jgi:hypothetical protein
VGGAGSGTWGGGGGLAGGGRGNRMHAMLCSAMHHQLAHQLSTSSYHKLVTLNALQVA